MENKLETAIRTGLRFVSAEHAALSLEDLWLIPMTEINSVAKKLHANLKEDADISFIEEAKPTKQRQADQLAFDIVKHIIEVRREESKAAKEKAVNAAKKARIRELLAKKDDESLENMSPEELRELHDSIPS